MLRMSDTQPPARSEQPEHPEHPEEQPTEPVGALPPPPPPPPTVAAPVAAPALQRVRLRDQAFGIKSLVAVAVAGVIVGGLGGFGIHAATDGDHRDGRMGRFGPGFGPRGGPGGGFREWRGPEGFPGGPGQNGGPGTQQLPPPGGTAPTPSPTPSPTTAPSQSS